MSEVVVVIGAGSIGQAIARRVSAGKRVVLADVHQGNADAAAKVLSDAGFDVSTAIVDVSSRESVHALVEAATLLGDVTVVIASQSGQRQVDRPPPHRDLGGAVVDHRGAVKYPGPGSGHDGLGGRLPVGPGDVGSVPHDRGPAGLMGDLARLPSPQLAARNFCRNGEDFCGTLTQQQLQLGGPDLAVGGIKKRLESGRECGHGSPNFLRDDEASVSGE